jgi:hypothetical protein
MVSKAQVVALTEGDSWLEKGANLPFDASLAAWHIAPPPVLPARRQDVSRDNLDENGGNNQGLKWRPIAMS